MSAETAAGRLWLLEQSTSGSARCQVDLMRSAAEQPQFELAARLRDEISELERELRGMHKPV